MPESLGRVQKLTGKSVVLYKADLCSKESLRAVMSKVIEGMRRPLDRFLQYVLSLQHKINCVIHFAALKAVGKSCQLPLKYYGNNVTGTSNLMEVSHIIAVNL